MVYLIIPLQTLFPQLCSSFSFSYFNNKIHTVCYKMYPQDATLFWFPIATIFMLLLLFHKLLKKTPIKPTSTQNSALNIPSPADSASSTAKGGEYEVFLCFRGEDTRKGFIDFLYTYLVGANIRTFRDNDELQIGEEIGLDVLKAIKQSKILIPVFSKNYASSKWCLRELAHMVECHKSLGQMIFPIFYDIRPFDVRNQKGSYEKAFKQHDKNFDKGTVQGWKDALTMVAKFKGLELNKETNGHEGELVRMVVEKVILELKKNYTYVPDNLVGMDHHFQEMDTLLDVNSNDVRIVGIHGMGGIGKTTISKAIYNRICDCFDGCCFLDDVRERSQHLSGVVILQNEFVSKILKQKYSGINNVNEGINKIKHVVHKKKILIVLDDIDDMSLFDKLVGNCSWFGIGSRIVVTTRNKGLLDTLELICQRDEGLFEVYKSYEPSLMNDNHSLQLFSKNAFKRDFPPEDYNALAKDVVSTAAGLPLVLVTIGSVLFGKKDEALWKEIKRKLQKVPPKQVLDKLKISFEALDYEQQQIFLDIACFFIGEDKSYPLYMWDDCEFYPRNGLNTLVLRSLIKVGDDNKLRMHDQLRDLGRQIVREQNINKPGEHSRVWHHEEALEVFKGRSQGTKNVEALNLELRAMKEDEYEPLQLLEEVYEKSEFVEKFRLLKTGEDYIHNLVKRDFTQLPNLRFLNLGYVSLHGDFSVVFLKLRWLKWRCCGKTIPINLNMKNLVILDLSSSETTDEWEGWRLLKVAKKLKVLNISGCTGLIRGPNFSSCTNLEILNLKDTQLREINSSLKSLLALRALDLSGCNLAKLDCPTLADLENLDLSSSESLSEVNGLEQSKFLTHLNASKCPNLRTLGGLSKFKRLKILNIYNCPSLTNIQGLEKSESLELLDMGSCTSVVRLPDLSKLRILKRLFLSYCYKLIEVDGLGGLVSLEYLDMTWCNSVERLPDLSNMGKLKTLSLQGCQKLPEIEGLCGLVSLENLNLSYCKSLAETLDFSNLRNLKELRIRGLRQCTEIRGIEELESLQVLSIWGCSLLEKLPDLSNLKSLKELYAQGCGKLAEVQGLEELRKRHCSILLGGR